MYNYMVKFLLCKNVHVVGSRDSLLIKLFHIVCVDDVDDTEIPGNWANFVWELRNIFVHYVRIHVDDIVSIS